MDENDILLTMIAEAFGEGDEGMRRVGETILNRAAIRGIDPAEVVRQPHQYTGFFAPGPAAVAAQRDPAVMTAAEAAWQLAKQPGDPTQGADHYHADSVDPYWADSMPSTGSYKQHTFYRSRPVPVEALSALLTPSAPVPQMPPARGNVPSDLISNSMSGIAAAQGRRSLADMFGPAANANTPRLQDGAVVSPMAGAAGWASDIFPNTARRAPARAPITTNDLFSSSGIADTARNTQAMQDPALAAALQRSLRPAAPPMPLGTRQSFAGQEAGQRGGAPADLISRSMTAARSSVSPSTQAAVEAWVKPKPVMTAAQQRADNGQGPPAARTAKARLPDIQPSAVGGPPTTRTVQSVPMPAQRTAPQQAKPTPMTIGAPPSYAGMERAAPSRITDTGQPFDFADLATVFDFTPRVASTINDRKDQSRLTNTSVIGNAGPDVLMAHGLFPDQAPKIAVPQVPPRRPATPQTPQTRVAITSPQVPARRPGGVIAQSRLAASPAAALGYARAPVPRVASPGIAAIASAFGGGGSGQSSGGSSSGGSFRGTATGRSYNIGQNYVTGTGEVKVANSDGSFTSLSSGRTTPGSSTSSSSGKRSYDPDSNSWR
ncbi:cell wall hydrolase [Devosia alba]|uniref:cell wall hydrolase n=1 Tax=Devosia alba TaxID=3152360 RepID=UPI0032632290